MKERGFLGELKPEDNSIEDDLNKAYYEGDFEAKDRADAEILKNNIEKLRRTAPEGPPIVTYGANAMEGDK